MPKPRLITPLHIRDMQSLNKIERRLGVKVDRPAIIVEDGFYLDFDADKTWKGNKGKDCHRGSV